MASKIQTAFALGLMIAKHVHGVSKPDDLATVAAITNLLKQVASSEFTLLNTPEEMMVELPLPPPELAEKVPGIIEAMKKAMGDQLPESLRQARREHREVAAELVEQMKIT